MNIGMYFIMKKIIKSKPCNSVICIVLFYAIGKRNYLFVVSIMIDADYIMSKLFLVRQFFQWYKISEHPDIPATTHLGLIKLCINSSKA